MSAGWGAGGGFPPILWRTDSRSTAKIRTSSAWREGRGPVQVRPPPTHVCSVNIHWPPLCALRGGGADDSGRWTPAISTLDDEGKLKDSEKEAQASLGHSGDPGNIGILHESSIAWRDLGTWLTCLKPPQGGGPGKGVGAPQTRPRRRGRPAPAAQTEQQHWGGWPIAHRSVCAHPQRFRWKTGG